MIIILSLLKFLCLQSALLNIFPIIILQELECLAKITESSMSQRCGRNVGKFQVGTTIFH